MSNLTDHLADEVVSFIFFGLMGVIIEVAYKSTSKKEA